MKKKFYNNKIRQTTGNICHTWKIISKLLHKGSNTCNSFESLIENGKKIADKTIIVNKFNDYFVNIGFNLASKIPNTDSKISSFLEGDYPASMYLYPTNPAEIINCSKELKNKFSSGHDGIPLSIMKQTIYSTAQYLACIVNCSINSGICPDSIKIAKVCPIYKSGDKENTCNYRPISVLSSFSKIFEKIICNRIVAYLNAHKILTVNQYGFRPKHSTCMAIVDMYNKISDALDNNDYSIGVFLDFSKAFDT